jgi:ATPase subunit of ABC transporter with duplicated ATPase domains
MALCAISNLTKFYGADLIFENISFEIESGDRIGLLGSNGVGKTTLLKIMMNKEDYHGGNVFLRQGLRIDYLDQIPTFPNDYKTIDVLLLAFDEIFMYQKEMKELERKMASNPKDIDFLVKEYGQLQQKYENLGGYRLKEKLDKILVGLNIDEQMQEREFNNLSGGEKSRVVMGKILLEEPDILLLDEPSNHLDIEYMGWLEDYLQSYQGAVVIVSHDRWFLKRSVNRIVELTRKRAELYNGGYEFYLKERERRLEQRYKEWEAKKKELERLEAQKEQYLIWGRSRDSEKMFRRAKEIQKRIDRIVLPEKPILYEKKIIINNDTISRSGNEVVRLEDVGHRFDNDFLFEDVNLVIYYQDRIGIVGPNGVGKTTLMKIMLGILEPTLGKVKLGSRTKVGYLPQKITFENNEEDLIEVFQRHHDITKTNARHELAKALFTGDDVFKTVGSLSGGEKSRLKLSIMFYGGVNVLFLDEPTNHLDIDSREKLEESLSSYDGTIIFVSHDRYFIDKIANKIIEIQPEFVRLYHGGYEFWQEKRDRYLQEYISDDKDFNLEGKLAYQKKKEKERLIRRHQRQIEECKCTIDKCEREIIILENKMKNEKELEALQKLFERKETLEEMLLQQLVLYEKLEKKKLLS